MSKKLNSEFAISTLDRSKVILHTTIKVGAQKAKNKLSKNLLATHSKSESDNEREIGEIIFKGLCQLRGTALKLAQFISSQVGLLKPEHLEVLKQSHYQVPPLNVVVVSKVIRNEFKEEKEQLFLRFEERAFSAASLGQVHRAVLKDGTNAAVKIQYPGVEQTVSIDLSLVRKFLSAIPRNGTLLNSLNSIEIRLKEETDYNIEIKNAKRFYNIFQNTKIKIPKTYEEYSSKRVITYEFVDGKTVLEWLSSNPSVEQRNHIGQLFWNFFYQSVFVHKLLHCDPNFGNFIIQEDLKLTILDFGCIQPLTDESVQVFKNLWKKDQEGSSLELVNQYINLGARIENNKTETLIQFYEQVIEPYKKWLNHITGSKTFDFSEKNGLSIEGQKILWSGIFSPSMESFSPEFTLIHRTFFGILQILENIGAKVEVLEN